MLKKWVAVTAIAALGGTAHATTYVVLPAPGSMAPATLIVDHNNSSDVFVCASAGDVLAGTCRLHRRSR